MPTGNQDTREAGPYVLMSIRSPQMFRHKASITGHTRWGALDDDHLETYGSDEISAFDPGEGAIFVEILHQAPGFPEVSGLGRNDALLSQDYAQWAPKVNEIVHDPMTGGPARLVGIHVDTHDFYFRLRGADGQDSFLSMAIRLDVLKDIETPEEHARLERAAIQAGSVAVDTLIVTHEVRKPWPRPGVEAAHVQVFGKADKMIFGPFDDETAFEAFSDRIRNAPGYGLTTRWSPEMANSPLFSGIRIPEDVWHRQVEEVEGDQTLEALMDTLLFEME